VLTPLNKVDMHNSPLISIVTPSFNQAEFILDAINSLRIQEYPNYEHLIIDGKSTDNTIDVLRALPSGPTPSKVVWISEADNGQSQALNKGFRLAKGEIIGWLNSDDRYLPECFAHVVRAFEDNPDVDIFYGDYRLVDQLGRVTQIRREIEFSKFILLYHHVLYIPTTTTFFRRRVFEDENWLEEGLQYAMDLEFFIRLATKGYRFKHIPQVIADFRLQPNSKTCAFPDRQRSEHREVVYRETPIIRQIESSRLQAVTLLLLRAIAKLIRSSEKMFRGYYGRQLG